MPASTPAGGKWAVECGLAPRDDKKWNATSSSSTTMVIASDSPRGGEDQPPLPMPTTSGPDKHQTLCTCKDVVSVESVYYTSSTYQNIQATMPHTDIHTDRDTDYLIIGDSTRGLLELFIYPEVVRVSAEGTFTIRTQCLTAPWFLPAGMWIATVIPIPAGVSRDNRLPSVYWAKLVGQNKPALSCRVLNGKFAAHLQGMVDTRANVTVIARSEWPDQWGLQTTGETLKGIGRKTTTLRSSAPLVIKGPDGNTATVRPFVVP